MKLGLLSPAALGGLALVCLPERPAAAQTAITYRYCMQPSGQWGPDCYYMTIEQCRATASAVGFCYENPAWTVAAQARAQRPRR
jgi:hypothetical protein